MAEITLGVVGAAATVGAAGLTAGSGFTGRHESSHRQEIMEIQRNTDDFLENLQSGDVTPNEEREFWGTRDKAIQRGDEYHGSIETYKEISWVNIVTKLKKKKEVRKRKRATRQSNHSLRSLNESMHSGSDTSSTSAESGSPPGSNLAADDIYDWASAVQSRDEPADHEDEGDVKTSAHRAPPSQPQGPLSGATPIPGPIKRGAPNPTRRGLSYASDDDVANCLSRTDGSYYASAYSFSRQPRPCVGTHPQEDIAQTLVVATYTPARLAARQESRRNVITTTRGPADGQGPTSSRPRSPPVLPLPVLPPPVLPPPVLPPSNAGSYPFYKELQGLRLPSGDGEKGRQSLPLAELGKGVPLKEVPPSWRLFIVEFKVGRKDLFFWDDGHGQGNGNEHGAPPLDIRVGDLVIVMADRGKDLGKVVTDNITLGEVEAFLGAQTRFGASGIAPLTSSDEDGAERKKEISAKMIYSKMGLEGAQWLTIKMQDEQKALALCQTKVRAKKLPMEVVDAEYQWDRRKLTFYFIAEKRIDFRELVRELFRLYKTRIEMASLPDMGHLDL